MSAETVASRWPGRPALLPTRPIGPPPGSRPPAGPARPGARHRRRGRRRDWLRRSSAGWSEVVRVLLYAEVVKAWIHGRSDREVSRSSACTTAPRHDGDHVLLGVRAGQPRGVPVRARLGLGPRAGQPRPRSRRRPAGGRATAGRWSAGRPTSTAGWRTASASCGSSRRRCTPSRQPCCPTARSRCSTGRCASTGRSSTCTRPAACARWTSTQELRALWERVGDATGGHGARAGRTDATSPDVFAVEIASGPAPAGPAGRRAAGRAVGDTRPGPGRPPGTRTSSRSTGCCGWPTRWRPPSRATGTRSPDHAATAMLLFDEDVGAPVIAIDAAAGDPGRAREGIGGAAVGDGLLRLERTPALGRPAAAAGRRPRQPGGRAAAGRARRARPPGARRRADRAGQPSRLHPARRAAASQRRLRARWRSWWSTSTRSRRSTTPSGTASATRCSSRWRRCCPSGIRPADLVARLGGDEFVVLLDGLDAEAARRRATDMMQRLAAGGLVGDGAGPRRLDQHRGRDRAQRRPAAASWCAPTRRCTGPSAAAAAASRSAATGDTRSRHHDRMRLTTRHVYDATPAAVWAMFTDPAFRDDVCVATGATSWTVRHRRGRSTAARFRSAGRCPPQRRRR